MSGGIFADGGLNFKDGDIVASDVEFYHVFKGFTQGLVVEGEVAVAGATVALRGEGLTDGAQMEAHVHLNELEDSLTLLCSWSAISACGHGWSGADISLTVAGYIRYTIDGAYCFAARANLFNLCHNDLKFKINK